MYEKCRIERTDKIVTRSSWEQYQQHLHDGEEQEERDRRTKMVPPPRGECFAFRDSEIGPWLMGYDHIRYVDLHWGSSLKSGEDKEQHAPSHL